MHARTWVTLALAVCLLGGCKQWKGPEKIAELEKRVDDPSDVAWEMEGGTEAKGREVGEKMVPKKKPPEGEEQEGGEGVGEGEGEDAGSEDKVAGGEGEEHE